MREFTLRFRCDEQDRERFQSDADKHGLSLSDYIRDTLGPGVLKLRLSQRQLQLLGADPEAALMAFVNSLDPTNQTVEEILK